MTGRFPFVRSPGGPCKDAGEAAGGDKRGRQLAAVVVQGTEPHRHLDMRVDDHTEPLVELRRLYDAAPQHGDGAPGGTTRHRATGCHPSSHPRERMPASGL
ncbi:MAG: DUF1028 domain-containing protein [Proteobacteria bacterium]|nr:DUF1028 domain-containing protein [Pseudomonadota bacterium]